MFRNPPSRLEPGAFFSRDERRRLAHLAAEYSPRELLDNPRILEDRSIEYAFLTSRLEGSTYSRKSAAILLKYGITDEKPLSDALMLCDIWKTFQYVISTAQVRNVLTKDFLCELHAIALGNHQLSEKQQAVRARENSMRPNWSIALPRHAGLMIRLKRPPASIAVFFASGTSRPGIAALPGSWRPRFW